MHWWTEMAAALADTRVAIVCVTPDNLRSQWIPFEAGFVAHALGESYVIPYLFQLTPTQLQQPLAQFQAVEANREGTMELFRTLNSVFGKYDPPEIDAVVAAWWPVIDTSLRQIESNFPSAIAFRSEREMLEELVQTVRALGRNKLNPVSRSPLRSAVQREESRLLSETEIEVYFEKFLLPMSIDAASDEWAAVDPMAGETETDRSRDVHDRAFELAELRAREIGFGKYWDQWAAKRSPSRVS